MQVHTSTISSQGQVTMPIDVRQQLGVKAGSVLLWEVKIGDLGIPQVIVKAGTVEALKQLRGVAQKMYRRHGGGHRVLQEERSTWET